MPDEKWFCSTSAIFNFAPFVFALRAKSRAVPAPLIPPPRINTSNVSDRNRSIDRPRVSGLTEGVTSYMISFPGGANLFAALALSILLDLMEWKEHHPPAIAIVALLHFVFAFAVISGIAWIWRRFKRL